MHFGTGEQSESTKIAARRSPPAGHTFYSCSRAAIVLPRRATGRRRSTPPSRERPLRATLPRAGPRHAGCGGPGARLSRRAACVGATAHRPLGFVLLFVSEVFVLSVRIL